ncbi:liver-expressed antimicrobial peptide 2-like [Megalops cyprinoides]|uniref:liver-expressed antimicrobial peptide 2-like n=1 Tax=Megalops cyprinoides TaxID=118141 RepID=UPI001864301A|nr:liver-expressed antimicrobial peptide 2-like [Megalops cyprinoides]
MMTLHHKLAALLILLCLLCALQVQTAPLPDDWGMDLIYRAKRSLLWRWNTLRPVGASCRDHSECGTKYCRAQVCSFRVFAA